MKILIVGAGPTGLTAAVELARLGIVPTIIDQRLEPSGLSRAVGITPSSLRYLAPSGVTEKLLDAAPALEGICGYFNQKHLLTLNFAEHLSQGEKQDNPVPLHCLPQDKTETILTDTLQQLGGQVDYGVEFLNLTQNNHCVVVTTSTDESEYDYVVAADGIKSQVREQTDITFDGFDLPELWSVADVDTRNWQHQQAFCGFLLDDGRVCVAVPIGENRVRLVANTDDALQTIPIAINIDNIRRQATFTISVRQASRLSEGRVHLAGDAAHCHSPVGGRGMNLGIADAAQLAHCLVNNNTQNYHQIRYSEVSKIVAMTERVRKMLTTSGSISRWMKPQAMKRINSSAFLQRRMILNALNQ